MKKHIESGRLVMLGSIQEQHADRCQLFKQWKGLDFPIVQDLLNSNGINGVPVYIAIDEHGVVRDKPRSPSKFDAEFINVKFQKPETNADVVDLDTASVQYWKDELAKQRSVGNLLHTADAMIMWQPGKTQVVSAIKNYTEALESASKRSDIVFRLGAANRMLYELNGQTDSELFEKTVSHWETALRMTPNQYIYRRRIEQYGPRLKKPYSFYDWVAVARKEIMARGEVPQPLVVEPNGAEFATRSRKMTVDNSAENPDPDDKIILDNEFVRVHANFVPLRPKPGDVVAVHVGFSISGGAKWNHETSPLGLWLHQPKGRIKLSTQQISDQTPHTEPDSLQPVSISFEVQIPDQQENPVELNGFALFNICESKNGQCIFRRKNVRIEIPIQ